MVEEAVGSQGCCCSLECMRAIVAVAVVVAAAWGEETERAELDGQALHTVRKQIQDKVEGSIPG